MKPEDSFKAQTVRDLTDEFYLENVEQRHTRGFPDTVLMCLRTSAIGLVEFKVVDREFKDYSAGQGIVVKSLKPHQINWLETRGRMGGHNRNNVGMLLEVKPFIFYVCGYDMGHFRDRNPTMAGLFQVSHAIFYNTINPDRLRGRMFGNAEVMDRWPTFRVWGQLKAGVDPSTIANELGRIA